MHRLIVLNGSLKQVKAEPFGYKDGKSLAEYLEDGWLIASQVPWGDHLVILLERFDHRTSRNGTAGTAERSGK
jgi:hypothetical protein